MHGGRCQDGYPGKEIPAKIKASEMPRIDHMSGFFNPKVLRLSAHPIQPEKSATQSSIRCSTLISKVTFIR